ncbi:MAG TPA: hypothetical protein VFJ68_13565 [Casimicrobiaceae bacterium]|nr:hypothetical protein [Casimicrobiaceae bacterium]
MMGIRLRTIKLKGDTNDYQRIYAVMVFPDQDVFRHAYMRYLMEQGRMEPDAEILAIESWKMPRWDEIKAKAVASVRAGILAGDYLGIWSLMDAQGIRNSSSRRAAQAVELWRRKTAYRDGMPFRASSRKVEGKTSPCTGTVLIFGLRSECYFQDMATDRGRRCANRTPLSGFFATRNTFRILVSARRLPERTSVGAICSLIRERFGMSR